MFEATRAELDAISAKLAQLRKFLDVPSAQRRLAELDSQMATDNFWNNQEAARKTIDEANGLCSSSAKRSRRPDRTPSRRRPTPTSRRWRRRWTSSSSRSS
jgi:hypothetical protein